ncbi:hypothetical protein SBOR_7449 [Sclerotinia borealis F-4128]|uniref:Uncharacterized protein n=1 Tax=Sclerotinia borealis (strain F-4128) TaxID=1432307 RepID=W9CBB6_SCLBF|nr:hypothetical protein SBOR_7449 [Sclerotinia borealis F-4128]
MVGVRTWTDDAIWYVLLASEILEPHSSVGRPNRRFTDEQIAAFCKQDVEDLHHVPDASGIKYVRNSKKAEYKLATAPKPSPAVLAAIERLRNRHDPPSQDKDNTTGNMSSRRGNPTSSANRRQLQEPTCNGQIGNRQQPRGSMRPQTPPAYPPMPPQMMGSFRPGVAPPAPLSPRMNNRQRFNVPTQSGNSLSWDPQQMFPDGMYQPQGYQMGPNTSTFQPQMQANNNGMPLNVAYPTNHGQYPQGFPEVNRNGMMMPQGQGGVQSSPNFHPAMYYGQPNGGMVSQVNPQYWGQQQAGYSTNLPGPPSNFGFNGGMMAAPFMTQAHDGLPQTTIANSGLTAPFDNQALSNIFGSQDAFAADLDIMPQQPQPPVRNAGKRQRDVDDFWQSDIVFNENDERNRKRHRGEDAGESEQMRYIDSSCLQRSSDTPEPPTVTPVIRSLPALVARRRISSDNNHDIVDSTVPSLPALEQFGDQAQEPFLGYEPSSEPSSQDRSSGSRFVTPPQVNITPDTMSRSASNKSAGVFPDQHVEGSPNHMNLHGMEDNLEDLLDMDNLPGQPENADLLDPGMQYFDFDSFSN